MSKNYFEPMHTTEHILNQTMVRLFNCERSFSNHIEKKKSKCDYHFDRDLNIDEITTLEKLVNDEISKHHEVYEEMIDINQAAELFNLERLPDQEFKSVRVIRVGDYDSCLCIGNHVKNTSEIEGKFKIISTSYDNRVLRIRFKLAND